jgi:hypothetical protein
MKRDCRMLLVTTVLLVLLPAVETSAAGKVLIILRHGFEESNFMLDQEVRPIIKQLTDAGFEVRTALDMGLAFGYGKSAFQVDAKLSEIRTADFVGIVIPCMATGQFPAIALEVASGQ